MKSGGAFAKLSVSSVFYLYQIELEINVESSQSKMILNKTQSNSIIIILYKLGIHNALTSLQYFSA